MAILGARLFNAGEGNSVSTLFGAVTSGSEWRFLQLGNEVVAIDQQEYHIRQLPKILGILAQCWTAEDVSLQPASAPVG